MDLLRKRFTDDARTVRAFTPDVEVRMLEALEKLMNMVSEVRSENDRLKTRVAELEERLANSTTARD